MNIRQWKRLITVFAIGMVACGTLHGQEINVEEVEDTTDSRYGAHIDPDGRVTFNVFSPDATQVNLLLYSTANATKPAQVVPMRKNGSDWRVRIRGRGIGVGLLYMYQAEGPLDVKPDAEYGQMFNPIFPLSDPYAYDTQDVAYSTVFASTPLVRGTVPVYAGGGKSIVYDHSRDVQPDHVEIPPQDLIIYELHVQDYTARIGALDSSLRGTYLGLARPGLKTPQGSAAGIDHLIELGINAVELMPIMEYDEDTGNAPDRLNHFGYMTTNFFAPESRYAAYPDDKVAELKQLIKALHDHGISVILDAVYNHSGEGGAEKDDKGQLVAKYYNFRGLCNKQLFRSTPDGRSYNNCTGTGNDIDFGGGGATYSKRLTSDSLNLWYTKYGIDGFRFDLARILSDRSNDDAEWVNNIHEIGGAYLISEPWDLCGQWWDYMDSGQWNYTNNRWTKWLGKYRDDIRNFSKSTLRNRTTFKRLIEGRGDTAAGGAASTKPWRSINFLAVHDGYTLRDVVYYNDNDGSQNCWDSGGDENLRREREKLMLGILLTSEGVPLMHEGDEFGRTKAGALGDAKNTYNYESKSGDAKINSVNWIDWRLKDGDNSESTQGPTYGKELFQWTKFLISLRKKWTHFRKSDFPDYAAQSFDGGIDSSSTKQGRITYSFEGPEDGHATQLAIIHWGLPGEPNLMIIYNENDIPFTVDNLRDWSQGKWKILARSWYGPGFDFGDVNNWQATCPDAGSSIDIKGRSMAILISENK
jgi:isoamylase